MVVFPSALRTVGGLRPRRWRTVENLRLRGEFGSRSKGRPGGLRYDGGYEALGGEDFGLCGYFDA